MYKVKQLAGLVDGIWREFDLDLDPDEDIELVECSCTDDFRFKFLRKKGLSVHTPLRELSILIPQSLGPKSHAPKPERPRPPTKPKCRVQVERPRPRNSCSKVTPGPSTSADGSAAVGCIGSSGALDVTARAGSARSESCAFQLEQQQQ